VANICVPFWHVIVIGSSHEFGYELRVKFRQIAVDKQKQDTCVEKLGIENTIGNA
jgi:hypothetical protein